jgi:hypothetical protein
MSEKIRRKKDGEDKNKENQRMREANKDADRKDAASQGQVNAARGQGNP